MTSAAAATPTATGERIPLLDAIRGVALMGILLANLTSFFGTHMMTPEARAALPFAPAGTVVLFAIDWLIEGKFYSLFSMLLGAGFALQRRRFASPVAFAAFFKRRSLVLIGIGALHMFVLWSGDILLLYGVMALALPALARLSVRGQAAAIAWLLTIPVATHVFVLSAGAAWDLRAPFARAAADLRQEWGYGDRSSLELFTSAAARDVWLANLLNTITRPGTYLQSGRPAKVLGLFLIGALIVAHILPRLEVLRRPLRLTMVIGGAVGLAGSFVYAWVKTETGSTFLVSGTGLAQTIGYNVGTTPLALAYASAMALLWSTPGGRRGLQVFTPLGRMALTAYLLQTVLQLAIFSGYGLGLAGRVPFVFIPLFAIVIIAVEHRICTWWLARFPQGPVEWLWRRLTYVPARVALRRHAPASLTVPTRKG